MRNGCDLPEGGTEETCNEESWDSWEKSKHLHHQQRDHLIHARDLLADHWVARPVDIHDDAYHEERHDAKHEEWHVQVHHSGKKETELGVHVFLTGSWQWSDPPGRHT